MEKMYLVPADKLEGCYHRPRKTRGLTPSALDARMRNVLQKVGLMANKKAKVYTAVFQKSLVYVKQRNQERGINSSFFSGIKQDKSGKTSADS